MMVKQLSTSEIEESYFESHLNVFTLRKITDMPLLIFKCLININLLHYHLLCEHFLKWP